MKAVQKSSQSNDVPPEAPAILVPRPRLTIKQLSFCPTPFAHERGAIVQFDLLLAHQSKSDIRNLHKPTSGQRQHQNTYARVQGSVPNLFFCSCRRQCDRVVRAPDLKSGGREFNLCSDR